MKSKIAKLALISALAFNVVGCNENDVINGVIIGGIIGGIVAGGGTTGSISNSGSSSLRDCEGPRREYVCEWRGGAWRRTERRVDINDDFGIGLKPDNNFTESVNTFAAVKTQPGMDKKSISLQKKWNLKDKPAIKLSTAVENAKGGDRNAFESIGLSLSDMNTLLTKSEIDADVLENVADSLETSTENALAILNDFVREHKKQKTNIKSALWNQCLIQGRWKTPETKSCSSVNELGCSPAHGATDCLPL